MEASILSLVAAIAVLFLFYLSSNLKPGNSKASPRGAEPIDIPFKNGQMAVEYACKFMDCSLKPNLPLPAVVVDARKEFGTEQAVKLEEDGTQTAVVRLASDNGGFLVPAQTVGDGPSLNVGDMVAWMPTDQEVGGLRIGLILGTLEPHLTDDGWVGKARFVS